MIDLNLLRKIAKDYLANRGISLKDAGELASAADLLTCPETLTVDSAKKVMGRDPDESNESTITHRHYWWEKQFAVRLLIFKSDGTYEVVINDQSYFRPTVGRFASLLLAEMQSKDGGAS